jgi:hypothetical protein
MANTDKTYNGWTNYETWLVNLWMDNDGSDSMVREWAEECLQDAIDKGCDANSLRNDAAYELGQRIRMYHDEMQESTIEVFGVFADLINASLREVNWYEIAEHYTNDITIYSAGWNMPGCLPDSDPALFIDAGDALEHIRDQVSNVDDAPEDAWDAIQAAADSIEADANGEFSQQFRGLVYWVSKV